MLIEQFKAARRVSTPLITITTADPPATVKRLVLAYRGDNEPPILQWDIIRGVLGLNEPGKQARAAIVPPGSEEMPGTPLQSPAEALAAAAELPRRALLFIHNANRIIENEAVLQAVCNLRDRYKGDGRALVMLAPQITLPAELVQDVLVIDEPLPDEREVAAIIAQEVKNARATMPQPPDEPNADNVRRAVEALSGLAAFPVEQAVAMSLATARGLDLEQLWTRKRGFIEQTPGLSLDKERLTFEDLGGLDNAKTFGRQLFTGKQPPRAIVRIDEIEKMLAGAAGDTSGVSQDALAAILREMEDQNWAGLIAVGPPGSGKSAYSKTLGRTHGAPTFALDLGATKGSLVGQSEQRIRAALKVIRAVAADGAFFVATCNRLDALPPELRRRFRYGLWFFDLPTVDERAQIWSLNIAKFQIDADQATNGPHVTGSDDGWTGAEIRNVCELAWRMSVPLRDAAKFIVPVAVSDPASVNKLRDTAHGKFLSASYPGPYKHAKAPNVATAAAAARNYSEA